MNRRFLVSFFIEAPLARDVHETLDVAEASVQGIGGRIFQAKVIEQSRDVGRCSGCGKPAHASETDDLDRCTTCMSKIDRITGSGPGREGKMQP